MPLGAQARKCILALHILASVGWMGGILVYLAFDVTAATSEDVGSLRTAYAAMQTIAGAVLVPLALAAFGTGIICSLASPWGLFRHYWVIASLILTGLAAGVLLVEMRTIDHLARHAATGDDATVLALANTLPHSVGGLLVLAVVLVLNIFKPRGMTRRGIRLQAHRDPPPP